MLKIKSLQNQNDSYNPVLETMPYDFRNRDGKRVIYDHPYDSDEEDFTTKSSCPDYSGKKRRLGGLEGTKRRRGRPSGRSSQTSTSSKQAGPSQSYPLEIGSALEWMIERKAIRSNQAVGYLDDQGTRVLAGHVGKSGIRCRCCNVVMTVTGFHAHTAKQGGVRPNGPYAELILLGGTGRSLLRAQQEAWSWETRSNLGGFNKIDPKSSSDGSDDACLICADGGRLFCCDNSEECSSTFHTDCMGFKEVPEGEWYCPYCVCKHCKQYGDISELLRCIQCNKKFHWDCFTGHLDLNRPQPTFCEDSCEEIHEKILRRAGIQNQLDNGLSWTLVRRGEEHSEWHISDEYRRTECHSKLAVARQVMKDCFLSTSDRFTQIDFIDNVVYSRGSNYTRINFSSFFSFVVEKNDQILATACVRVHGPKLAEMAYIATREEYRKMGIGKRLLDAVTEVLRSMKVTNLVIPSAKETRDYWKRNGFKDVDESTGKEITHLNTLMFPEVIRLHLPL